MLSRFVSRYSRSSPNLNGVKTSVHTNKKSVFEPIRGNLSSCNTIAYSQFGILKMGYLKDLNTQPNFSSMARAFCTQNIDGKAQSSTPAENKDAILNPVMYEYLKKMKLLGKEATRMVVDAADLEIMEQPEFLGRIGVDMNELEYYVVKKDSRIPSK